MAHPAPSFDPMTTIQSRSSWVVEVGRYRFGVTRMRETRSVGRPAPPMVAHRSRWPIAIGTFASVSAFGLVVVGALASPHLPNVASYRLSVPVPVAATPGRSGARLVAARAMSHRTVSHRPVIADAATDGFDAEDESHVAIAMRTGAFQEWRDADGRPRFLTAGAARNEGDRHCRDLALLVHLDGGGSHVRTARRCAPGTVDVTAEGQPGDDAPLAPTESEAND